MPACTQRCRTGGEGRDGCGVRTGFRIRRRLSRRDGFALNRKQSGLMNAQSAPIGEPHDVPDAIGELAGVLILAHAEAVAAFGVALAFEEIVAMTGANDGPTLVG